MEYEFIFFYAGKCYLYCDESNDLLTVKTSLKKGLGIWINKDFSKDTLDINKIYITETRKGVTKQVLLFFKKSDGKNVYILKDEYSNCMLIESTVEYKISEVDKFVVSKTKPIGITKGKFIYDNKLYITSYYETINFNVNVKPVCLDNNVEFNFNYGTIVKSYYEHKINTEVFIVANFYIAYNHEYYYIYDNGNFSKLSKNNIETNNKYNNFKIIDNL